MFLGEKQCFLLQLINSSQVDKQASFSSSMMRAFQRGLLNSRFPFAIYLLFPLFLVLFLVLWLQYLIIQFLLIVVFCCMYILGLIIQVPKIFTVFREWNTRYHMLICLSRGSKTSCISCCPPLQHFFFFCISQIVHLYTFVGLDAEGISWPWNVLCSLGEDMWCFLLNVCSI